VNGLDAGSRVLLDTARVAHLATADQYARPHVVPIVFVLAQDRLYFPLDRKPKREDDWHMLRRVRNIETNGRVSIVVDQYEDDWTKLAWVLLEGVATILETGEERDTVAADLAKKYTQYRQGGLDGRPVVRVQIERTVRWSAADAEKP
jgi:PPOX class probable F420-dependent enzyme